MRRHIYLTTTTLYAIYLERTARLWSFIYLLSSICRIKTIHFYRSKWVYTMFRKIPHLDDLVFWFGEMHMIIHDDLLTHSWGINRGQLLLRRMDSGEDIAQIQCDRFLKGNVWSVFRPHSITDSALSDLHMEAFLESEVDYTKVVLASFAMNIICQERRTKHNSKTFQSQWKPTGFQGCK